MRIKSTVSSFNDNLPVFSDNIYKNIEITLLSVQSIYATNSFRQPTVENRQLYTM